MKYLFFFLSLCLVTSCIAQQKPEYDRTRTAQVLSDYATRSRYFIGIPSGPVPSFPSYVPDSVKCGALFNKTTAGQRDTLKVYDCNSGTWNNAGSVANTASNGVKKVGNDFQLDTVFAGSKFLNVNQTTAQTIKSQVSVNGSLLANGLFEATGGVVIGGGDWYNGLQIRYGTSRGQIALANDYNAVLTYFIYQDNVPLPGPSSLYLTTNGSGGVHITNDNIYDSHGLQFLKSGSGGIHSANSDSLGSQPASYYLNRANHTGSQAESTITNLITDLAAKSTAIGLKQPRILLANPGAPSSTIATGDTLTMAAWKLQAQINSNGANISTLQGQHTSDYTAIQLKMPRLITYNSGASNIAIATGDSVNMALSKLQIQVATKLNTANPVVTGGYITIGAATGTNAVTLTAQNGSIGGYAYFLPTGPGTSGQVLTSTGPSTAQTWTDLTNYAFGSPTVITPTTSDSSKKAVNSEWVKQYSATLVQYFTPGMFGHTGTAADPFQYGTASIPMSALNATGTPSSSTVLYGDGAWRTVSSGFSNPMTTLGDLIKGGSSGAPTRMSIGLAGQILGVNTGGTDLEYKSINPSNGILASLTAGSIGLSVDQTFAYNWTGVNTYSPTNSASSGTSFGFKLTPTNVGTSTNAYTGFFFNLTNTSNGSGAFNLFDWQVGGSSKLALSSSGFLSSPSGIGLGGSSNINNFSTSSTNHTDGWLLQNTASATSGAGSLNSLRFRLGAPVYNSTTSTGNYGTIAMELQTTAGAVPKYALHFTGNLSTTQTPGTFNDLGNLDQDGNFTTSKSLRGTAVTFANVPSTAVEGMLIPVTDSSTATIGATITGGGSNHVLAYYNGTNWTVH